MVCPTKVLVIEDSENDYALILYHLKNTGLQISSERVENAASFMTALEKLDWDIIISDYYLPVFNAPEALNILQKKKSEIPFIVISGAISEETATNLMQSGAADYLLKDRLARLGPLVKRELGIARVRRERRESQAELQKALENSKKLYQEGAEAARQSQLLLIQLKQRAEEQEKTIKLTSQLRNARDLEGAQKILVEQVMDIFQVDAVALFSHQNGDLIINFASGKWGNLCGSCHKICENAFKEILRTSQPFFVNSPEEFFNTFHYHHSEDNPLGSLSSCALVPINVEGAPIGLLALGSYSEKEPLETQRHLLATVAEITGITIQRLKATENLEQLVARRTRELSALYNVITSAGQSKVLKDKLEVALKEVISSLNCSLGGIIHFNGEKNDLICTACEQLPAMVMDKIVNSMMVTSCEGWMISQDEAVIISDIASDKRFSDVAEILNGERMVCVGVPIKSNEKILGFLSIFRIGSQDFSLDEISFICALANHIGVIIENHSLIEQVESAVLAEERARLSRDLHDSVTQTLYSSTLFAETGLRMMEQGKLEQAKEYLARLSQASQQALKETRLLIYQLRPDILRTKGLIPALRQRLELVENKVAIQAQISVNDDYHLRDEVEDTLYWTANEALNNILKHAQASRIEVNIQVDNERVIMEILDDGIGFEPDLKTQNSGMGLNNIRDRLIKIGGSLEITSTKGKGSKLTAICPIEG